MGINPLTGKVNADTILEANLVYKKANTNIDPGLRKMALKRKMECNVKNSGLFDDDGGGGVSQNLVECNL